MKKANEEKIGIHKDIDALGRLLIPKEMRELFFSDKTVEMVATKEGILLRDPQYILIKKTEVPK